MGVRNSPIAVAISLQCVSRAKWPVSKSRMSAPVDRVERPRLQRAESTGRAFPRRQQRRLRGRK